MYFFENVLLIVSWCSHFRIFWYSKQFEGKTSEREPWYGTDYIIERIEDNLAQVRSCALHCEVLVFFGFDSRLVIRPIRSGQIDCKHEQT